ncbi:MAG: hypothetical protein M3003_09875 [Candidatus Dormibacteraeota bacterium]|nr:hypothetical protein [Candidatus Dormibacteraeota bacterium]
MNFIDTSESTDASSAGVGQRPKRSSIVGPVGVGLGATVGVGVCERVAAGVGLTFTVTAGLGWLQEIASKAIAATRTALMAV